MKRYKHNLSHRKVATHAIGKVIPLSWFMALPGDSIRAFASGIVRLSPLNGPFFGRLRYKTYTFAVPIRLIWDDFEDFITAGLSGNAAPIVPSITTSVSVGSLMDHLRIPPKYDGTAVSRSFVALVVRAYMLICNTYFKDKDLDTPAALSTASGPDTTTATSLQVAQWGKDFLTTVRPWNLRGTAPSVPVTGSLSGHLPLVAGSTNPNVFVSEVIGDASGDVGRIQINIDNAGTKRALESANVVPAVPENAQLQGSVTNFNGAYADAAAATLTGLTIDFEDLRIAGAQYRLKEARAWFGSEYPDYLAFLGVTSSDARLRKPEFVGGSSSVIQVSEVLQTAQTDPAVDNTGVGNLYGHGIAGHHQRGWLRYFEEHCIVMTVAVCRPDAIYSNGMERELTKTSYLEWWQKEMELIGAQEVRNDEVFADQVSGGGPTGQFGFNNRFYEYMHVPDAIAGDFRTTLAYMTTARQFGGDVALNNTFVDCNASEQGKLFQNVAGVDSQLWANFNFGVVARRMLGRTDMPRLK